jgi:fructose-1,6-bisphosphatase
LGNNLFDYHINKNPKDIIIFCHYYRVSKYAFNKGKKLFPKLFKFLINKVINNEYLSYKQKKFYQKEINLTNN